MQKPTHQPLREAEWLRQLSDEMQTAVTRLPETNQPITINITINAPVTNDNRQVVINQQAAPIYQERPSGLCSPSRRRLTGSELQWWLSPRNHQGPNWNPNAPLTARERETINNQYIW